MIYSAGTAGAHVISNNVLNGALTIPTTGLTYLIYNSQSSVATTITNNNMTGTGISRTGASGTMYGYYNFGTGNGFATLSGNTWNNISVTVTTVLYGAFFCFISPPRRHRPIGL